MKKHCEYYYTTRRHILGERNTTAPILGYTYHIRNKAGDQLETSIDNEPGDQYFETRGEAEHEAKDAIKEHYR